MTTEPDYRLCQRAMAAYFRAGDPVALDQPQGDGHVVEHDGKLYVVLSNVNGPLAVYRVRPSDGILRRLKRWPAEVG